MAVPHALGLFFKHPEMHIPKTDFDTAVAFIQGYDSACNRGVLVGFREWLILKLERGNNLAWPELFLRFAFPGTDAPRTKELPKADHRRLTRTLFDTIEEFSTERDAAGGLERVLYRHAEWVRAQDGAAQVEVS